MKKKVLIISASPRKGGNSDMLCDKFLEGALDAGHNAEKVRLSDKKIAFCNGCYYCADHKGACVYKDDMTELLSKMISADVIVLASPVYFYTIDGQLKTFIDRCVARYTEISGKEFYYIITAADTEKKNMSKAVECLRGFAVDCLEGTKEKDIIYGLGVWKKGEIGTTPFLAQAYKMGKNC